MGQLMRRHWIPACLSEEVVEPDGAPVRVRLLGEDLVVFRDTNGRLGVLDEYCPHRRASLALGRNEECGLRCLYHGWKMDVDGNIVDMASEPPEGSLRKSQAQSLSGARGRRVRLGLYGPARGDARIRAARLGPAAEYQCQHRQDPPACNWAQVLEGPIDSAHSSSLHSSDMSPARVDGAKATATPGCGPRPTSRRASRCSRPATASATPRSASRSSIARDP